MNTFNNRSNKVLRSSWMVGIMALVAVMSLDWSSMCHPSPEGAAIKDQIRTVAASKANNDVSYSHNVTNSYVDDVTYNKLSWEDLSDVEFNDVYVEELDAYYWKPKFGPNVKGFEGKKWYITGYIIPVDIDEDFYVLSRYPFANCFFCGGAGPETVVDLQFGGHSPREYATDERLTFAGELKLNADDVYQMNYIIKDAHEFTP
ncbi:MAG: hypothetical protein COA49_04370 [Bacteroidetes bacterium]|nr:MAG: hypothetical protein COA49_04370 [Bacteroidota bacterium]